MDNKREIHNHVLINEPKIKKNHKNYRNELFPYFLIAPTIILIIGIMLYPILRVFYLSVFNFDMAQPWKDGYIGIENYTTLMSDMKFWSSLIITLKWVFSQIFFQLILGMILALLLNQKYKGRGIARAVSLVPWAVSGVLVTMLWTLMYDQSSGLINELLLLTGLIDKKIAWLADPNTFFSAVVIAELWRGIPFFAISLLAALQSIPKDVYESSAIDGCGPGKNFLYITLPYLKETIIFTTLLRGIWEFNSIDMIFTMTNGGPMDQTTTLPIYMMKTAIIKGNYGYGSTVGVVAFIILLVFAFFYIKLSHSGGDSDEN